MKKTGVSLFGGIIPKTITGVRKSILYNAYSTLNSLDATNRIANIEKCIQEANNFYKARKEQEFQKCLMNLKQYCEQLSDDEIDLRKLNEKSWNFIIQQFCNHESFHDEANYWFKRIMKEKKVATPNSFTLNAMLKVVSNSVQISHEILQDLERQGQCNIFSFINYTKVCLNHGDLEKAFSVIQRMQSHHIEPSFGIVIPLLKEATSSNNRTIGLKICEVIKESGLDSPALWSCVASFAFKMKLWQDAIENYEKLKNGGAMMNVVTWNCLIQAYLQKNEMEKAIYSLREMKDHKFIPDSTTFSILLSACAKQQLYEEGKSIHALAKKTLNVFTVELSNTIINFYSKCGYPEIAIEECEIMKKKGLMNVVTWTCLIQAYIQQYDINKALDVIDEMQDLGIELDPTLFTILLNACAKQQLHEEGKTVHALANKTLKEFPIEFNSTVIDFYSKCGHPDIVIEECEKIKKKGLMNVVTWTCLIQAYIKRLQSQTQEDEQGLNNVFRIYQEMKQQVEPNMVTFNILLIACGEYVASDIGMKIIQDIKHAGLDNHESIISGMLYFYSRIGDYETAQQLFDNLVSQMNSSKETLSVFTYGNMLSCYPLHGKGYEAQKLFGEMIEKKVELNEIIFIILLKAYSHCGMVKEAIELYDDMISKYNINPNVTIDCVMVDVYSRAGQLEEAEKLIGSRTDIRLWTVLMGGCRKFNNIEMGEKLFNKMTSLDETIPSPYILLSHIYTYHGLNEKANEIRELMQKRGIKRIPGIVYHEENGKVYKFISGSTKYERFEQVETMLDEIYRKITQAGFKPDTRWVTHNKLISEEEKVNSLCRHAEKIAIAHAFVLNPNRKKIVLTKNLRVCIDCHNATAFISKVMQVEIIVRDGNRYHHFKDGKCSCDNYW